MSIWLSISLLMQFLRNILCVWRTLWPQPSFLFRSSSGLHQLPPVNYIICIAQLYVFLYNIPMCYHRILKALSQNKELSRLHSEITQQSILHPSTAAAIMRIVISHEYYNIVHWYILPAVLDFINGIAYIPLAYHTIGLSLTDEMSLPMLATLAMQYTVVYSMYRMWYSYCSSHRLIQLANQIIHRSTQVSCEPILTLIASSGVEDEEMRIVLEQIGLDYSFAWLNDPIGVNLKEEITKLETAINRLIPIGVPTKAAKVLGIDGSNASLLSKLHSLIKMSRNEKLSSLLLFLVNLVSWYGYTLNVSYFYFPLSQKEYLLLKYLSFGSSREFSNWLGVLVGDIGWGIEPLVVCYKDSFVSNQPVTTAIVPQQSSSSMMKSPSPQKKGKKSDKKRKNKIE